MLVMILLLENMMTLTNANANANSNHYVEPDANQYNVAISTKPHSRNRFFLETGESLLHFMSDIINNKHLETKFRKICTSYFLLYWRGEHLKSLNVNGSIQHNGLTYVLVFKDTTPYTAYHASQVRISFRVIPDYISNCNYAVVTIKTN